jgi:hypothetical protein
MVKDVFRNTKEDYADLAIELACGLHNFRSHCRLEAYYSSGQMTGCDLFMIEIFRQRPGIHTDSAYSRTAASEWG